MQLATVGKKYQIVIPKEVRCKISGIRPGVKVGISTDKKTINVKPQNKNWADETYGIMEKAWKGLDTTKLLEEMRNEWNRKV